MSVSIAMVRVFVAAVEHAGASRERLLAAAQIDATQLDDVSSQVSLEQYDRALLAAHELSGDQALGLHIGEHAGASEFDVVGNLTGHAATLRQGLETLQRYARIVGASPEAELREHGDTASVRYAFPRTPSLRHRFASELTLAGLMRMMRQCAGRDARPRAVYFAYEAPAHRSEYTRIFAGTERFEHSFTGIEFERAWLERSLPYKSSELYGVLQAQAERALGRLTRTAALAERVSERIAAHDPRQLPTMEQIARELGMSARSLRRQLLAEGAVYKTLVEHVSMRKAKRMLEDPRASIQETAYATGFATSAAFHRAFKRWTGMTPKQYRALY